MRSVGYDSATSVLEIEFHNGSIYQYFSVPSNIHQGLMGAPSHGQYHHRHIRDRYRYRQIR
ncbi:MAG: KTSC domain-containing protein [Anaerolineae bacterium]|nr:KTSC domain-containing protein [Anaerolineae bacterium]